MDEPNLSADTGTTGDKVMRETRHANSLTRAKPTAKRPKRVRKALTSSTAIAIFLVTSMVAYAAFLATANSAGTSASTAALASTTNGSCNVSGSNMQLAWALGTAGSQTLVERDDANIAGLSWTTITTTATGATSYTDAAGAGSWQYRLTPRRGTNWAGPSAALVLCGAIDLNTAGVPRYDSPTIPGSESQHATTLGDINGDGIDDFAIGCALCDSNGFTDNGQVFVVYGSSTLTSTALIDIGQAGMIINGQASSDNLSEVKNAGDVNGDGIADIGVSAEWADNNTRTDSGSAYIIFGTFDADSADIDLNFIGTRGFRIDGAIGSDRCKSVNGIGDFNNDGRDDIAVTCQGASFSASNSSSIYPIWGSNLTSNIDLNSLGTRGIRIDGETASLYVKHAYPIGDSNGDGIDDIAFGSQDSSINGSNSGTAWVIYGSSNPTSLNLFTAGAGARGYRVNGTNTFDKFGVETVGVGDYNNDGRADWTACSYQGDFGQADNGICYVFYGQNTADPADITLSVASSSARYQLIGGTATNSESFGTSVVGVGDINTDGIDDFAAGTYLASPLSRALAGRVEIIHGRAGADPADFNLASPSAGQMRSIYGQAAGDNLGSFNNLGGGADITNDGIDDLIVSSPNSFGNTRGSSWIIAGYGSRPAAVTLTATPNASTPTTQIDLTWTAATGTPTGYRIFRNNRLLSSVGNVTTATVTTLGSGVTYSFRVQAIYATGPASSKSNRARASTGSNNIDLSTANILARIDGGAASDAVSITSLKGDINGDGFDDFIVSSQAAGNNSRAASGSAYVIYGSSSINSLDLNTITSTSNLRGFRIDGAATGDQAGSTVSYVGDFNGDGIGDFTIGAPSASNNSRATSGSTYVVYGTPNPDPPDIDLSTSTTSSMRVDGALASDSLGRYSTSGGDYNGDGIDDVLMVASAATYSARVGSGVAYVVYGQRVADPTNVDLASLGTRGFLVGGAAASDALDNAVSIGDYNGDGLEDFAVGSPVTGSGAGAIWIVYGRTGADPVDIDLATVNNAIRLKISGPAGESLRRTREAGDFNGDGRADIIVSAQNADHLSRTDNGAAYLLYGQSSTPGADYTLTTALSTSMVIDGATSSDFLSQLGGIGDYNGDGIDDVGVASPVADNNSRADSGSVYVIYGQATADPANVDLNSFASRGFRVDGAAAGDNLQLVAGIGDVNGDGRYDIVLASPFADNNTRNNSGSIYAISGTGSPKPASFNVTVVPNLTTPTTSLDVSWTAATGSPAGYLLYRNGILRARLGNVLTTTQAGLAVNTIYGYQVQAYYATGSRSIRSATVRGSTQAGGLDLLSQANVTIAGLAGSATGSSVASIGDINADGLDDVLFSASNSDFGGRTDSGSAYVVYGAVAPTAVNLASLGTQGFRIDGAATNDFFGFECAAAGDFNGDGIDDFLIGAPNADNNSRTNSGSIYVIYGQNVADPTDLDVASLGARGVRIDGSTALGQVQAASALGDVNGDGISDIGVGAYNESNNARAGSGSGYIVYGQSTADPTDVDLATSGTRWARIDGAAAGDGAGWMGAAGDFNADGINDIYVGARSADNNSRTDSGSGYIVYGQNVADFTDIDLNTITTNAMRIDGAAGTDNFGWGNSAGDFNADGIDDVAISAPNADNNSRTDSGSIYVIYGQAVADPTNIDVASLGARGIRIDGAAASDALMVNTGAATSISVGDQNSDGIADIGIVGYGADNNSRSNSGSAYIIYGQATADPTDIDLNSMGSRGFRMDGAAASDNLANIGGGGDFNGDGKADLVLGPDSGITGTFYIVYGSGSLLSVSGLRDYNSEIESGAYSSCSLRPDATIRCWGRNQDGALGNAGVADSITPSAVIGGRWVDAAANGNTACAIKAGGSVWCWGSNQYGMLGNGNLTMPNSNVPVQVANFADASDVTVGANHACAVRSSGSAWCWGLNANGQLGNQTTTNSSVPVKMNNVTDARQIVAGDAFTCVLRAYATVSCTGNDTYGQLGNGVTTTADQTSVVNVNTITNTQSITANGRHACAVRGDATVYCWGNASNGRLGNGATSPDQTAPVAATSVTAARNVGAGTGHSCVTLAAATAKCWGTGANGRLGNNASSDSTTSVAVSTIVGVKDISGGTTRSCAQLSSASVRCWGGRAYGGLGDGATTPDSLVPVTPTGL